MAANFLNRQDVCAATADTTMKLTRSEIHAFLNCGCPNRHQNKILGIRPPYQRGWVDRLTKREFTPEEVAELHRLRKPGKKQHVKAPEHTPKDTSALDFANRMYLENRSAFDGRQVQ